MTILGSEAQELTRQSEDRMDRRNAITIKGMVAMLLARYADALEPFRESVAICRELGLSWQLGTSYLNLGTALLHAGLGEEAVVTLRHGLRVYRELGDDVFAAHINNTMAHAALARDDVAEANRLARKAVLTSAEKGERQGMADGLQTLAAIAGARSDPDRAAILAGAAAAIRDTIAARPGPFDLAIPGRYLQRIEKTVTAKRWRRSWDAGHGLQAEDAVAYALAYDKLGVRPRDELQTALLSQTRPAQSSRKALMFTDLAGSTSLIEAIGDAAWQNLSAWLDGEMRRCFQEHMGHEVDHAGDGFFVVFESARNAVACAIGIQRRLLSHRRLHGYAPQMRIGIHLGEVNASRSSVRGAAVHRAARLCAAARADAIVVSREVLEASGRRVTGLRKFALKGISEPVEAAEVLWQA
jgi:class 3 adenylate cyclase